MENEGENIENICFRNVHLTTLKTSILKRNLTPVWSNGRVGGPSLLKIPSVLSTRSENSVQSSTSLKWNKKLLSKRKFFG